MTLASHVRTLGRGPGRSRSLAFDEARDAMAEMLSGDAAPESVGALLMLLRMKGEETQEIAGFVSAAQESLPELPPVDLDWSSYAAGRTRGLPWFLLSARLVAASGHRVLMHGFNGIDGAVRDGLAPAGVPVAEAPTEVGRLLDADNLAYLPLETISPALFHLLGLRPKFNLRSCVNTVCRMFNPARAPVSVQGVFHPPYRLLQSDAAALLGWDAMTVIKGGGGEFERNPAKPVAAFGLRGGAAWEKTEPALIEVATRMNDGPDPTTTLAGLWSGEQRDSYAEAVVIGTAALALDALGVANPLDTARNLWDDRG
ncbi:glycosyl transferase family protein [Celeribacter sp.]|uniref:glycosyl transferase family protein n=1 Tax=Celeribacter sp. TaxID=1890673 RepID=UPI003A94DE67